VIDAGLTLSGEIFLVRMMQSFLGFENAWLFLPTSGSSLRRTELHAIKMPRSFRATRWKSFPSYTASRLLFVGSRIECVVSRCCSSIDRGH